jgi:hypothetical protein
MQRTFSRKDFARVAWIVDGGGRRHRCQITDVSANGARLALPPGLEPEQNFTLLLTEAGNVRRYCELSWRGNAAIGVRFIEPVTPIAPVPEPEYVLI